ncbi:MAG: hypothetical protein M1575_02825 [Patescibacteria group bacterium]|nr:hypothetical protein [Patescibacteria group bacterium]MCL5095638.1 hypothetical protein [Patescibacteria group bacterium]
MIEARGDNIHEVSVYYLDDQFYVVGSVRIQPFGFCRQVEPVYMVQFSDGKKLAQAIESARLGSDVSKERYFQHQIRTDVTPWDGDYGKVWAKAAKLWEVDWYEDGSVEISPQESYDPNEPDLGEGKAWRGIDGARKILLPPLSAQNIAEEILSKVYHTDKKI